ncbi:GntR family transcriptional regulator [Microbacterium pseudoresistens]|uniref:DNA-binding transcriptional regulator YhcF (GntR family) n=1 Tax=Microbacterium pseudoresistens TaxID=640634 RepID=A0A7Y9JN48_9MICO|nr:GntR family transcriptional regulator [Microbacterium pseudoresistens]NYD53289.1 DNA-binding transcriptional regulator YhcF (GntR family) [Microbacterium pseudoresistens]
MIITIGSSGGSPAEQIRDQIAGFITSGQLAAGERLPSVRQLAADLGVAPGTVAKAYRVLEANGQVVTRMGAGTRVSAEATSLSPAVLDAARSLRAAALGDGVDVDEAIRILRAIW